VTLAGPATLNLECGATFTDPGASALDACDGVLPVVVTGSVDVHHEGSYVLTYTATDHAGNASIATLTVTVADSIKPVVTLAGAATLKLECGATFTDPGATALDACDGVLPVVVTGSVDAQHVGSYVLTYTATDHAGNIGTATLTVTVVDTTKPVVNLSVTTKNLWPPNHKFVDVGLSLIATDNAGSAQLVTILSVTQDESLDSEGDGSTAPDAEVLRNAQNEITGLRLRAERAGGGDGRVYLVRAMVADAAGNQTMSVVAVTVPKSQSKKDLDAVAAQAAAAVSGAVPLAYNSLGLVGNG
jgi:hypothetical protein